jgi:hypothetical protein
VEDRFERILASWEGKLLSDRDRLVLISLALTNLSMFMLSFFEIPIEAQKRLDFYRSRLFWQSDGRDGQKKKHRLTRRHITCIPRGEGRFWR